MKTVETRICTKCQEKKVIADFYSKAAACKVCAIQRAKLYRLKNLARWKANSKGWKDKNRDKVGEYAKKHYESNKEKVLSKRKLRYQENPQRHKNVTYAWIAKNKDKVALIAANRKAKKLMATPVWSNSFFVKEAYSLAILRTKLTGINWHVDHMVPLKSKTVCGLHAHTNMRVILAAENYRKNNYRWEGMP